MSGSMRLAVTGNPIIHSKSPDIFSRIFNKDSVSGFYSRIAADTIEEALQCAKIIKISGMNVTSPFKEDALNISESKNIKAELLKASNTLTISGNSVVSDNTDPEGVAAPVLKRFSNPSGLKAVVIGAGGAGTAACYALSGIGFNTVMVNRTLDKALQKTAAINNCTADTIDNINMAVNDASLVIHTLPVSEYFFDIENLKKDAVLFDANYKYSPLKKIAENNGLDYIDGREWLIGQAEAAYGIFRKNYKCGERVNERIAKIVESNFLNDASLCFDNISLVGFMGSGKSAAGRFLAERTGYEFIDSDSVIEKKAGITIKEMFETKGEGYFRNLERDVLAELLTGSCRKIISCGGGAVGDIITRGNLKKHSLPVWLAASPEVSLERISDNKRPLLNTADKLGKAVEIFNSRIDYYGLVSELIINSELRDAEKTAGRIYDEICEFL